MKLFNKKIEKRHVMANESLVEMKRPYVVFSKNKIVEVDVGICLVSYPVVKGAFQ